MLRRITYLLIMGLIISVFGCNATTKQVVKPNKAIKAESPMEAKVPKDKSVVYVFRKSAFYLFADHNPVQVDGSSVGTLTNGSYLYGTVEPGQRNLVIGYGVGGGFSYRREEKVISIKLKPNQIHYYNVELLGSGVSFTRIDETEADKLLKSYKLIIDFDLANDAAVASKTQKAAVSDQAVQPTVQPSPVKSTFTGNSWAVVVGISEYQYSGPNGLNNLIFADDDALAFKNKLRKLGWSSDHIKILINEKATQRNIMITLESWLTKAGPNDQIVLFWAGHGFPDPEDPEKVYFACYDTDINIPVTGYRMDRIRNTLEERKAKNVIVLADTCHAGKLITRGNRGVSVVSEIEKMKREQNIPKGWVFMVGADTDRQSIEHSSWSNGAFTHCLIKGLSGKADGFESVGAKDGIVTMRELRAYMNTSMPDETQRVLGVAKRPVITTSTGDPDIWNMTLQAK